MIKEYIFEVFRNQKGITDLPGVTFLIKLHSFYCSFLKKELHWKEYMKLLETVIEIGFVSKELLPFVEYIITDCETNFLNTEISDQIYKEVRAMLLKLKFQEVKVSFFLIIEARRLCRNKAWNQFLSNKHLQQITHKHRENKKRNRVEFFVLFF